MLVPVVWVDTEGTVLELVPVGTVVPVDMEDKVLVQVSVDTVVLVDTEDKVPELVLVGTVVRVSVSAVLELVARVSAALAWVVLASVA